MNDLVLGGIVLTWIAVPLSLLVLALADVIRLDGEGRRRRWIRRCLAVLFVPLLLLFGRAAWGWAGAAHLEPLCQAYAMPEFRSERPLESVRIEVDRQPNEGTPPAWVGSLVSWLEAPSAATTLTLEVRRITHHTNRLFTVTMDRFRLIDRRDGLTLAAADELWIDAGAARYHCGIESGLQPTRVTRYPSGAGIARFVERALQGKTSDR